MSGDAAFMNGQRRMYLLKFFLVVIALAAGWLAFDAAAADECALPSMRTDERPGSKSGPTLVSLGLLVADVTRIDDVNQTMEGDFFVKLEWRDPRLVDFAGCRFHRTAVWFPLIRLLNSSDLTSKHVFAADQVQVHEGGRLTHVQRYFGSVSTYHQLQNFPFDRHKFRLRMADFDYPSSELVLVENKVFTRVANLLNVPDWKVHGVEANVANTFIEEFNNSFSMFAVEIDLSRNSSYYVGKVLVPMTLIVLMSWVVFWIDPAKFGPQVGLSVTAMLTLIAFQFTLTTSLPKVGYFTVLDQLLLGSTILVFLSLIEATYAVRLVSRGQMERALRLDATCRWLFPLAFVLLWLIVLLS